MVSHSNSKVILNIVHYCGFFKVHQAYLFYRDLFMVSFFDKSIKDSVQIIHQDIVYQGYYQVRNITLRHHLHDSGWINPIQREVVMRGNAVSILLFDPMLSQFAMNEQFRVGPFMAGEYIPANATDDSPWLLEIAGGMIDSEESLEAAAHREALEETGLMIQQLVTIGDYWTNPTNTTEKVTLFCGKVSIKNKKSTHGLLAEGEDIRVHAVPIETAYEYLENGKIKSVPALIALQWFKLNEAKVHQLMQ